jgi:hypothetical protein
MAAARRRRNNVSVNGNGESGSHQALKGGKMVTAKNNEAAYQPLVINGGIMAWRASENVGSNEKKTAAAWQRKRRGHRQ